MTNEEKFKEYQELNWKRDRAVFRSPTEGYGELLTSEECKRLDELYEELRGLEEYKDKVDEPEWHESSWRSYRGRLAREAGERRRRASLTPRERELEDMSDAEYDLELRKFQARRRELWKQDGMDRYSLRR